MSADIRYVNGALQVEGVALADIATQVGTPFYAYSAATIQRRFAAFHAALADLDALICFALKANGNQAVLSLLAQAGAGAEVVSEGELRRALAAGIAPEKIVFSGVGKSAGEVAFALEQGILCLNVESLSELQMISDIATRLGVTARLSVRINPDVDPKTHAKLTTGKSGTKFGIAWDQALDFFATARALPNISLTGIDTHIGSQITNLPAFDAAFARLVELVHALRAAGHVVDHMDLGGGLGVAYQGDSEGEETVRLAQYATIFHKHFTDLDCRMILEPGRFIVANAGVFVTRVLHLKPTPEKTYVVVDGAMNDLIRPTMYDAHHAVLPLCEEATAPITADIVGPVCEPGDFLAKGRKVACAQGDLLALMGAGAYGAVLSSTYNARPLVPEVLVHGADFDVVRPRQSIEALIAQDRVPAWLRADGKAE
ncbi:diaminopimelate decarboxylase [Profundibacter amoris]|uniref:Diaminopimelate decarboxylase n=1 Tax=Profundibacter amoris TaxID=2171755 RepID=A0A347UFQ7_9RHOB|nr:diaminopimelate decarboxylase [Profundibacter amoris]AXX97685.1 diaminopimelate decarboxylase [Profundibacter amoris]